MAAFFLETQCVLVEPKINEDTATGNSHSEVRVGVMYLFSALALYSLGNATSASYSPRLPRF